MIVHAYIEVSDLERVIEFYAAALGLRLRRRLESDWVELGGANVPIASYGYDRITSSG
jgi:predicted enzyme related to lactoylglutathione lyase